MKPSGPKLQAILNQLPEHLRERTFLRCEGKSGRDGDGVWYWTHHALRSDENPALDVARLLAQALGLPLTIYQGLSESYRFASDRHHTMILEAAQDLAQQYAALGLQYCFHLERRGNRSARLARLAHRASVIVTEDFPIEATRDWTDRLAESFSSAPWVLVDTACIVPTRLVNRAYDRAFAFRSATAKLYAARVDRDWPACDAILRAPAQPPSSLRLSDRPLSEWVAECDIDHSIGPVADTRGGSTAGYERWDAFRRDGLSSYAKRRNKIEIDGVSRMSAYLHYGMVSPFRLAREASREGAEKYVDELLIWRELAYAFCYYRSDLDTDRNLPTWAIETLLKHRDDSRSVRSWETLSRANSGDALWDAAQRSLVKHGELHNKSG